MDYYDSYSEAIARAWITRKIQAIRNLQLQAAKVADNSTSFYEDSTFSPIEHEILSSLAKAYERELDTFVDEDFRIAAELIRTRPCSFDLNDASSGEIVDYLEQVDDIFDTED